MGIRIEIDNGEAIPRFYRIAWRDFYWDQAVCYPIGLHLIAMACRRVWEWSYLYRRSRLEILMENVRRQAYAECEMKMILERSNTKATPE